LTHFGNRPAGSGVHEFLAEPKKRNACSALGDRVRPAFPVAGLASAH
jgi:hypothetical protein